MLTYIFTFFKYFLMDKEDTNLNIKYFSLYNDQILNQNKGLALFPAALLDIKIDSNIEQFSNRIQRPMVYVDVYTAVEAPLDLNSGDILTQYYLDTMKLSDNVFKVLEGVNGSILPSFDPKTNKFFANSVHRYSTELITFEKGIKVARTTYKFMLLDLTGVPEYELIKLLNLDINSEVAYQINS